MPEDTIPGRQGGNPSLTSETSDAVGFPPLPSGRSRKADAVLSVAARMKKVEEFLGLKEEDDDEAL